MYPCSRFPEGANPATEKRKALLAGQLRTALVQVSNLLGAALTEHEQSRAELQCLDDLLKEMTEDNLLDELRAGRVVGSPPVTQKDERRRVVLAPHPSPLAETPMRTGETLPVPTQHCRSKWTSPNSEQCGKSARPSFTGADLQAARAEAWAERMAASEAGMA